MVDAEEVDLENVEHLLIGSSLPWLLPPVLGDLQTINELFEVTTKPLDDEIGRLERELVRARKAVADLITEDVERAVNERRSLVPR